MRRGSALAPSAGSFDLDGERFSASSRNAVVDGATLRVELRDREGEWRPGSIDLSTVLRVDDKALVFVRPEALPVAPSTPGAAAPAAPRPQLSQPPGLPDHNR